VSFQLVFGEQRSFRHVCQGACHVPTCKNTFTAVASPLGDFGGLSPPQTKFQAPPQFKYETLKINGGFVKFWNVKPPAQK